MFKGFFQSKCSITLRNRVPITDEYLSDYFAYMYVCVQHECYVCGGQKWASGSHELELQATVVGYHMCARNGIWVRQKHSKCSLTIEPPLLSHQSILTIEHVTRIISAIFQTQQLITKHLNTWHSFCFVYTGLPPYFLIRILNQLCYKLSFSNFMLQIILV